MTKNKKHTTNDLYEVAAIKVASGIDPDFENVTIIGKMLIFQYEVDENFPSTEEIAKHKPTPEFIARYNTYKKQALEIAREAK